MKSTSWSVSGPPRAQQAIPPPRTNGTSASRSACAVTFIASITLWNPSTVMRRSFPGCRLLTPRDGADPGQMDVPGKVRIAAAGDVHARLGDAERLTAAFVAAAGDA